MIDSVEIFDPATGSWTEVAAMSQPRLAHRASRLDDGTVLVTGGMQTLDIEPYRGTTTVEVFRMPVESVAPRMPVGRRGSP